MLSTEKKIEAFEKRAASIAKVTENISIVVVNHIAKGINVSCEDLVHIMNMINECAL